MAVGRAQVHRVKGTELVNIVEGLRRERALAFEGMQDNPLQQISQAHVFKLGDRFEDFEQPFFDSDAGLHAFNFNCADLFSFIVHVYQFTTVRYFDDR